MSDLKNPKAKKSELLAALSSLRVPGTAREPDCEYDLLVLAVTTTDDSVRDQVRLTLEALDSPPFLKALKVIGKRDYAAPKGETLLEASLERLGAIDGLDTSVLARKLFVLKPHTLSIARPAARYFWRHAPLATISDYFAQDCEHDISTYGIATRAAEVLWQHLETSGEKVRRLQFSNRELTEFPQAICGLRNLEDLQFSASITRLPDAVGDLKNLRKLKSLGNPLASLPESFGNLVNLQDVYFSDASFNELPGSFSNLTNLQSLAFADHKAPLQVSPAVLALPKLDKGYRAKLELQFAPKDEYARVVTSLDVLLNEARRFTRASEMPTVTTVLANIDSASAPFATTGGPELLLALAKCYFDQEHGRQSNDFFSAQIEKTAPHSLQAASTALAKTRYFWRGMPIAKVTEGMQGVVGFDVTLFIRLSEELLSVVPIGAR